MEDRALTLIAPYDDYQVMAGAGTAALEAVNQLPSSARIDTVALGLLHDLEDSCLVYRFLSIAIGEMLRLATSKPCIDWPSPAWGWRGWPPFRSGRTLHPAACCRCWNNSTQAILKKSIPYSSDRVAVCHYGCERF